MRYLHQIDPIAFGLGPLPGVLVVQGGAEVAFQLLSQTSSTAGPLAIAPRGYLLVATQPTTPSPTPVLLMQAMTAVKADRKSPITCYGPI